MDERLSPTLQSDVMDYLGVAAAEPALALLTALVSAYTRRVPWESASRIVRYAEVPDVDQRPRGAQGFWEQALAQGTGGTCFESNWACAALLRGLGFACDLTINNMHEHVGCHTALVVHLDGQDWLVDMGYPLYVPVRIDATQTTTAASPQMGYTLTPAGPQRYTVEQQPHPKPYAFTLDTTPVDSRPYWRATCADYDSQGLFLNRVIIHKIVDERTWRFDSQEQPYCLQTFEHGTRTDHALAADPSAQLSAHFGMARSIIAKALACVGQQRAGESA